MNLDIIVEGQSISDNEPVLIVKHKYDGFHTDIIRITLSDNHILVETLTNLYSVS